MDELDLTFNPRPSKETHSKIQQASETSVKVFYEQAPTFLPNDLMCCCCLWWEGTPERGVTDHWDTMPSRAPAVQNTPIHQHSHYSNNVCSPLSRPHEKSPFANKPEDGWQWITHIFTPSNIRAYSRSLNCMLTHTHRNTTYTHACKQAVMKRAKLFGVTSNGVDNIGGLLWRPQICLNGNDSEQLNHTRTTHRPSDHNTPQLRQAGKTHTYDSAGIPRGD